jgi:hypothetical protein
VPTDNKVPKLLARIGPDIVAADERRGGGIFLGVPSQGINIKQKDPIPSVFPVQKCDVAWPSLFNFETRF